MKKTFLFIVFLIISSPANASTIGEMGDFFTEYYEQIFKIAKAWIWIVAYVPIVAFFWALYAAHERTKIKTESEKHRSGTLSENLPMYLFYVVGATLSIYLVLGTFGLVFAKAPDFGSVWDKLVVSYWKSIL
jgi:Trk-type K+ transport system membrane component